MFLKHIMSASTYIALFTPGHDKLRVFMTHGGQSSLMQAVYHAAPVLAIPLFGDQFDNVVRAESKGFGLILKPTELNRERLSSTIQTLIQDVRYVGDKAKVCQCSSLLFAYFHHLYSFTGSSPQPC